LKYSTGRLPRPEAALLLAALLAASCGEAHAASPVSLDVVAGIGGVVRTGRWAPFIVTVDNRGPALEARLSLEVFRGSELRGTLASRLFHRDVELPARSRRRFTFAAPVVSTPRPAVVRVTAGTDGEPRELAHLEIDLRRLAVNDRLIVAVSSEIAFDFLAQEGARVVYPHAENLPESWAGWSGVDLVVVRDTAFHRLGTAQAAALERWVQAGGTIVFTGGAAALQLAASGLAGLLPVEVSGLVEPAGLQSLGRLAGAAPPVGPATIAGSVARSGATVLAAEAPREGVALGEVPLVAVRRTGAGMTAWLAFDPADRTFASWPGLPALWRAVAGDAAAIPAGDDALREPLDDPWIAPLAARSDVSFPSHARLAIFLAAFLLPSLALLLVPRRLGSHLGPRLRAGLLLLLAAAASAAGWFVFNRWLFRGDDFLLEAVRVEASDGSARLNRRLAVCSPSGGGFELALGPVDSRVEDVSAVARGRSPDSLAIELADAMTVRSPLPGRFQSRLLIADSVIPFALSAVLEKGIAGARLTVENRTGTVIREAFLVFAGGILPLGDVASGPASIHDVPVTGGAGSSDSAVVIADVGRRAFWERESAAIGRTGPVLVGWLDEPPLAARLGGAPAAASACMVTLEVAER
jgi:hypothetical protein